MKKFAFQWNSILLNASNVAGVTGATINIDFNGDSEGNFSVLAYKPYKYLYRDNLSCNYHMVPVAHFQQGRDIPVSELSFLFIFLYSFSCKQSALFRWSFCN